jgi:predicted  nucleic acid-binding Zn-ribbon protein
MILADKINNLEKEINTKPDELQQLKPKLQNLKNKFEGNYYYCCNSFIENLVL